ncbi:hypothetical protein HO133_001211 [Letharia lupina]|uniref:Glycosyltransferase family 92 protein n=2 Tax=Letharia TaxID=112415 RepID=A0A8H6FBC8_9LECA|nr:uncharacterized protein HO133_001211 [Letharia lupina]KAF6222125.1 hypothetical protein HO133_001211 [Letharia lupina]
MFYSHQNNDFWDRPIVFSPKRIVRVLTICVLVTLSLFTVLWIAPGRRPSRTLAPLRDKAADSTSHSSSQDNSLKELQYPSTESTNLKEPSYSSSKSSDLEEYPHSRESSDLKEASYPEEKSVSKEKTKSSHNLASLADSGTQATFTKTPYPPLPPGDDEEYISICMAVKNQHVDLLEWFPHYYYHHGIRRFYVMDDGSQPPISILPDYGIPRSAITFVYIPRTPIEERPEPMHHHIYGDMCIKDYGKRHTWMGFLDADEFLEMRNGQTLMQWLHDWEHNDTVGAVAAQWLTHNSAGLLTRPEGGARKNFDKCVVNDPNGENKHVKMFVRTELFQQVNNVHHIGTKDGYMEVGEHGDPTGPWRNPVTHEKWALHHYGIKSRQEFIEKQDRGNANALAKPIPQSLWEGVENMDEVDCKELTDYYP